MFQQYVDALLCIFRSASLPEHILDNVSLPLSKLELEKVANAIGGTERVAATSSDKSAIAAEDTVGNFNDGEVAHMKKDSTPSVGGISCHGPPSSGGVTSTKGGGRSGHYPKLSWDSNNGGAESGTDWMENGSNDYSNLEVSRCIFLFCFIFQMLVCGISFKVLLDKL